MASNSETINEEIEALQAIMMDEVIVRYDERGQANEVEITVTPATAQNVEEQHVRVDLIVCLPQVYPDESPSIILRNPRGIDDDVLQLINRESRRKCEEYLGLPVIYELIELTREKLTANNTPSCPCAICLFHFMEEDNFTKTLCFHYFHSHCLGRYILNCEETAADEEKQNVNVPVWMVKEKKGVVCPICREPLNHDVNGHHLIRNPPPIAGKNLEEFCPDSAEFVSLRQKMESLYLHQKSIGGIIDLEEEKNKFLISAAVEPIGSASQNDADVTATSAVSLLESNAQTKHEKPQQNSQRNANGRMEKGSGRQTRGRRDNTHNEQRANYSKNHKQSHRNYRYNSYAAKKASSGQHFSNAHYEEREEIEKYPNKTHKKQGNFNNEQSKYSTNFVKKHEFSNSDLNRSKNIPKLFPGAQNGRHRPGLDPGARNGHERRPRPGFEEYEANRGSNGSS